MQIRGRNVRSSLSLDEDGRRWIAANARNVEHLLVWEIESIFAALGL
jgi:hypothetical protein